MRFFRLNVLSDKALADIVTEQSKATTVHLVLDGKALRDSLLKLKRERGED